MAEALIEIRDLCKIYNPGEVEVRALDHVNLTINRGELVAIIGQSGSGKSTLMNQLGCLDVPTSGDYYLSGQNVAKLNGEGALSPVENTDPASWKNWYPAVTLKFKRQSAFWMPPYMSANMSPEKYYPD